LLRPDLNIDELTAFLERWAGGAVRGVSQFESGQVSSVFGFEVLGGQSVESGKYVVRFVPAADGGAVRKDRFIGPRAAAVGLPTPRLLKYGEVRLAVGNLPNEERLLHDASAYPLAFAICDLMPGEHMDELEDAGRRHLVPAAVEAIDKISLIDISDTTGWGLFDSDGNGMDASWAAYIEEVVFPEDGGGFYERRRDWFEDRGGFLEFDVFRKASDRMMSTLEGLPEIARSVVHIDFGYDNTLVIGNEVSAILDWDNSIIGDHLYDGARTDVYASELDWKALLAERYELTGRDVPGFDDRWLVCQLHVVLQALQWYGRSNSEPAYHWMKARMLYMLGEGPAVGRHPSS